MGGGDVSAIADRIAGRDLDRDHAADCFDEALERLALLSDGVLAAGDEVEVMDESLASVEETGGAVDGLLRLGAEAFKYRLPFAGPANVGMFVVSNERHAAEGHGADWDKFNVISVAPISAAALARKIGAPKSGLGDRLFVYRETNNGAPVYMRIHNGSLWTLGTEGEYNVNGLDLRDIGGGLKAEVVRVRRGLVWLDLGFTDGELLWDVPVAMAEDESRADRFLGILRGARAMMVRRFNWGVSVGHPGFPSAFVECSPEGARALFADRNVVGGKRRTALRHWVKEHYRRGHTPEESHKVREHLRGVERFTWHGLDVKLQVPSAEIEAAGLLARSGR